MAVATDATLKLIANNVGSIDTTGLMTDITGQAINNSLQSIKLSIDDIKINPELITIRKTSAQAITVEPSAHTILFNLTLTKGLWIISGCFISPSGTGYRQVYVTNSPDSISAYNTVTSCISAVSGTNTNQPLTGVLNIDSNTDIYIKYRHNNATSINIFGIFNAIKVGDFYDS